MEQARGVLFLRDPLDDADARGRTIEQMLRSASEDDAGRRLLSVAFPAGEKCLPRAQAALRELRKKCRWVCVAATPGASGVALFPAEQLPVERLALIGGTPFSPLPEGGAPSRRRELRRMDSFAKRNLALVVAELLLVGIPEGEEHRLRSGLGRSVRVRSGTDVLCFAEEWRDNGK